MKKFKIYTLFAATIAFLGGCKPTIDDKIDLPAVPTASFTVQAGSNANRVKLVNTTPDAFLFKWDLGNGTTKDSNVVDAYFPFKGTYKVTLTAFNKGGFGTATKDVVIAQDDPTACAGNLQLLTGCSSKTWKLAPQAGALLVGPDANFSTVWWQNGASDVAGRACQFDDEYTFTSSGVFNYDNKGDFWADADNNGNVTPAGMAPSVGCQPASVIPTQFKAWSTNSHRFSLTSTDLTVVGTGAFIGLYKVATGAEVTTPQASVTYKIKELTASKLVVLINFGPGFWQFTLVPK
ncbi:MAG: PKD domain-containing protein [Saprospiraceae bacterium]|nr:PKD domain-containing protein [Saprospiraceae bacterium]